VYRLPIERPIGVLMISTAAALFGLLSYGRLGLELMPDLNYPSLTLRSSHPGAAPEEVESEITAPLESRVGTVEGLMSMHSSSQAGQSEIILEFNWDTDMDQAAQRVRERLGRMQRPPGAEPPRLLRHDPSVTPVMRLGLRGKLSLIRLRRWAQESLAPELSKRPGVAAVRVLGGIEPEMQVNLSLSAIAARGLSVAEVAERLRAAHVNIAGGRLKEGRVEYRVRSLAELQSAEAIRALPIHRPKGPPLLLGDLAQVQLSGQERQGFVRVDGQETVRIDILRRADASIVAVCDQIKTALKEDLGLPRGAELLELGDQSLFIRAALDEVKQAALLGGLLAVLIIYLFLGSPRATMIIALSIPLSICLSFIPMMLFEISLNVMSLGGLALGVGMLVDNSVVVLESIHRCREEGDGIKEGAERGVREVGAAVTASTLTTVAVFFPILFIEGVAGQVFQDLALSVVFSLLSSLMVALFLVPSLAARTEQPRLASEGRFWLSFRSLPEWWAGRHRSWAPLRLLLTLPLCLFAGLLELLGNLILALLLLLWPLLWLLRLLKALLLGLLQPLSLLSRRGMRWTEGFYRWSLQGSLRRPSLLLIALLSLGGAALYLAQDLGAELLPELRQGLLQAELSFPVGTPLEESARRSAALESALGSLPEIKQVEALLGSDEELDENEDRGSHSSTLTLSLASGVAEELVLRQIREICALAPGLSLKLSRPALFSMRPPIRVVLMGHHLGLLAREGRHLRTLMEQTSGLSDVQSSLRTGHPELLILPDLEILSASELDARALAERVRDQLAGRVATRLRGEGRSLDLRVRLAPELLESRQDLESLRIGSDPREPVSLGAVADFKEAEGPAEIRRLDGQRVALFTARSETLDLGRAVEALKARLSTLRLPPDLELRFQGQDEEMQHSLESLRFALLLAIFLVYVVMASQFESLRAPLVIMGSLPLAGIGVLIALILSETPLSVLVFVGLITLAGIVVNNAIVLVDYAGRLRARGGRALETLVQAGLTRLRPILMTTITTVLGLLPLALGLGEGAELRQPIALTLIGGLIFSTALTLLLIPVLYNWVMPDMPTKGSGDDAQAAPS